MMRKPQPGEWRVLLVNARGATNVLLLSGPNGRVLLGKQPLQGE